MATKTTASFNNTQQLLFYTCATGFYRHFVIPYMYFAAKANPGCRFEFIVENVEAFKDENRTSIDWLRENFQMKLHLKTPNRDFKPVMENSWRFIMEPELKADIVYIGDIDIFIVENILDFHGAVFRAGLPYSNVIRPNTKRLSGLHVCRFDTQYPLPEIADLVSSITNDEELLYAIVERKGLLYPMEAYEKIRTGRPIHGAHLSLNRLPFSNPIDRPGWGLSYRLCQKYEKIFTTPEFQAFLQTMSTSSRKIIANMMILSRGVLGYEPDKFQELML